jgi:nucleolar protein 4
VQVKDSDAKDEADEAAPAEKHKGKSHKTDPGCNGNHLFFGFVSCLCHG